MSSSVRTRQAPSSGASTASTWAGSTPGARSSAQPARTTASASAASTAGAQRSRRLTGRILLSGIWRSGVDQQRRQRRAELVRRPELLVGGFTQHLEHGRPLSPGQRTNDRLDGADRTGGVVSAVHEQSPRLLAEPACTGRRTVVAQRTAGLEEDRVEEVLQRATHV